MRIHDKLRTHRIDPGAGTRELVRTGRPLYEERPIRRTETYRSAEQTPLENEVAEKIRPHLQVPISLEKMKELIRFILTRASGTETVEKMPPPPRTLFEQQVLSTQRRGFEASNSSARAVFQNNVELSADQLSCLFAIYGQCAMEPAAQRRLEAAFLRIKLGEDAEADKTRFAKALIALDRRKNGGQPIEAELVDKVARVYRIGGLTQASQTSFAELLGAQSLSGTARLRYESLLAEDAIGTHAPWTFFVHIDAHGTLANAALDDVLEMEKIGSRKGEAHVVALISSNSSGRSDEWRSGARILHIRKGEGENDRFYSNELAVDPNSTLGKALQEHDVDTRKPELLRAAVEYVKEKLPSDHLLVNLWGHGSTPNEASRSGQIPRPDDWQTALKGLDVDLITCDACSMGLYESAVAARESGAKYYLASQFLVANGGWRYDTVLARASAQIRSPEGLSPEQLSRTVTDHFVEIGELYPSFSAIDLSKLENIEDKLSRFAELMIDNGGLSENKTLKSCWDHAIRTRANFADIGDLALQVGKKFKGPLRRAAIDLLWTIEDACYQQRRLVKPDPDAIDQSPFSAFDRSFLPRELAHRPPPLVTGLSLYAPSDRSEHLSIDGSKLWGDGPWAQLLKTLNPSAPSR